MAKSGDITEQQQPYGAFGGDSRNRILFFAVAVPVMIWTVNTGIVGSGFIHSSIAAMLGCYVVFVGEIALIAWCVGRYMRHPVLRCVVFLWCIAFVDVLFVLIRFSMYDFSHVGYSFASAQLGLLIAWAVLGTSSLGVRVFAAFCGLTAVMTYVSALTNGFESQSYWVQNDWDTILTWQAIATLALCCALRWRRFRILPIHDVVSIAETRSDDDKNSEPVQFSIMHLLMWTSALAPIFAVARLVDWNALEFSYGLRMAQFVSLAVLLSLTSLVAIWSGLGVGHALLRMVVVLIFTVSAGAMVAFASKRRWLELLDLDLYQSGVEAYIFWITWTVLAGFFYVAMLLILRATDQRLMRK